MTSTITPVDLSNCDREPIHLCGAIQPHGVLISFSGDDLRICHVSDNVGPAFGSESTALLGTSLADVLESVSVAAIREAAQRLTTDDASPIAMSVMTPCGERRFDAIMHRSGAVFIVELEPLDVAALLSTHPFHGVVRGSIEAFAAVRTVKQLCAAAVTEVAHLTAFDRVMIYRFDPHWNGEVVAESCAPGVESFLGLHYPASDIPAQARDIFKQNWLRFIPDVAYVPSRIIQVPAHADEPLDLSRAVLRSVSSMHIEYLKNMSVGATLTISLLKNGELWGLIACHHAAPKMISYQLRFVCEMIGRSMSLNLGTIEENEDTAYRIKLKTGQMRLLEIMSDADDMWSALSAAEPDFLALVGATGAAIRFGDECRLIGQTPPEPDVLAITDWLATNGSEHVFVTDSLPLAEPRFERLAATACGIIALALSPSKRSYIVWFRPEFIATVSWAGDPARAKQLGTSQTLSPRKSFALWSEVVALHSRAWTEPEVDAAREWARSVSTLILDRAEELERANRELASLLRSNVELDAFAHIASHDLKEPLRGIHNYASFLMEDYGTVVGTDGREKLETLVRLSKRMEELIDSLLALSSIGRSDFVGSPTLLQSVVDEVLELYAPRLAQCRGRVEIVTSLPLVQVDRGRLTQVFSNLLANALKYNEREPRVEIGVDLHRMPPEAVVGEPTSRIRSGAFVTVFVRDNGIGIPQKHLEAIFRMFKRLHSNEAYGGGTGAGLAVAKKIVERHDGVMWAESRVRSGTTFYFTLPTSA